MGLSYLFGRFIGAGFMCGLIPIIVALVRRRGGAVFPIVLVCGVFGMFHAWFGLGAAAVMTVIVLAIGPGEESGSKEKLYPMAELDKNVPDSILDFCKKNRGDRPKLEAYLNECVNQRILEEKYVKSLLLLYAPNRVRAAVEETEVPMHGGGFQQNTPAWNGGSNAAMPVNNMYDMPAWNPAPAAAPDEMATVQLKPAEDLNDFAAWKPKERSYPGFDTAPVNSVQDLPAWNPAPAVQPDEMATVQLKPEDLLPELPEQKVPEVPAYNAMPVNNVYDLPAWNPAPAAAPDEMATVQLKPEDLLPAQEEPEEGDIYSFSEWIRVVEEPAEAEPEQPEIPAWPEIPAEPEQSEIPAWSEIPAEPEQPEIPAWPEIPAEPEQPEISAWPEIPAEPEQPETPAWPEVPAEPEQPEIPAWPEIPEEPEIPEIPAAAEEPEVPETPAIPEEPAIPEIPAAPAQQWEPRPGEWAMPIPHAMPVRPLDDIDLDAPVRKPEPVPQREPEPVAPAAPQISLEEAVNRNYPGMMMYIRDMDLHPVLAARYETGKIIRERSFVDATERAGGMVTSHRFVIASNHMTDMQPYEPENNWQRHVARRDSRFKVLGQTIYGGRTAIFLIHLPDDESWKLFRDVQLPLDQQVLDTCIARFRAKCLQDPIPELATAEWLSRCATPVGMDETGEFYSVE